MLNKLKYIPQLLLVIFLQGCATYQTFYSATYTSTEQDDPQKVLRLDLSYQEIDEFPKELSRFPNLKMLNLSGNSALNLETFFAEIKFPEMLEVLILDNLELQELPENILRFKNLKHLSLNKNPLLPWDKTFQKIAQLPLQFLNLQHNELSSLPKQISKIQTLKDLNLSNNNITVGSTFEHLATLPKLYSLWLSYNKLETLSPEIGQLKQLKNFYIGNNKLKTLPDELKKMENVWVLQAEHNNFTIVPEVLIEMPALFSAHLNNCSIESISEIFATQKYSMKGLLLDNNKLSQSDKKRWKKEFNNFFLLSIK